MIRFISIDSSLANTGIATGYIDEKDEINVETISLHETKKDNSKKVRASSDTIARCQSTYKFIMDVIAWSDPHVIFIETPSGSQNSSAMKSYGATCQLIGSLEPNPIQVTPAEVKLYSVGIMTATKDQMIKWAHDKYPNIGWDKHKDGTLKNKNEHMADAIAIAYAGIKTPIFNQLKIFNK